jgi:hypothetical protein
MAAIRDVLLKLEVRTSKRANKCKRNANHKIPKGDLWLIVTPRGPAARDFGYCVDCGITMLEVAQTNLSAHLATLRAPTR